MKKHYKEYKGESYPVRTVTLPKELGGYDVDVADVELYNAMEDDYSTDAMFIDNSIYYYMDSGFIDSDPTDEEIINKLIEVL